MSSFLKTPGTSCPFNDCHRCLGKRLYLQDWDIVGVSDGYMSGEYIGVSMGRDDYLLEMSFGLNKCLDGPTEKQISNHNWFANGLKRHAKALGVPAFHILYWLGYDLTPATYWLPVNDAAKAFLARTKHPFDGFGKWFTIRECSCFLHMVKGLKFNKNEPIDYRTVPDVLKELLPSIAILDDLPNMKVKYTLPKIEWK